MSRAALRRSPNGGKLFDMVEKVGLEDDVVRWGLNTVISESRHRRLVEKVFEMRRIVHEKLMETQSDAVEFYDVNRFSPACNPLPQSSVRGCPGRMTLPWKNITENPRFI